MNNVFFKFIEPYLSFIDKGDFFRKPFCWLYVLLAAINIIFPFYVLYEMINVFSFFSGQMIFGFILVWLGFVFTGWLGFQLWWNRKDKVLHVADTDAEFVAVPAYTHFIQTFGEWLGMYLGIVGCWTSIIVTIFGQSLSNVGFIPGSGLIQSGFTAIFLFPVIGFLITITTRVFAELLRALASIANNTKNRTTHQ